jgi:hypothetical protein
MGKARCRIERNSSGVVSLFNETVSLGIGLGFFKHFSQILGLLGIAENAAAFTGRAFQVRKGSCRFEFGKSHFFRDLIDFAAAGVLSDISQAAMLGDAIKHVFDAIPGRIVIYERGRLSAGFGLFFGSGGAAAAYKRSESETENDR